MYVVGILESSDLFFESKNLIFFSTGDRVGVTHCRDEETSGDVDFGAGPAFLGRRRCETARHRHFKSGRERGQVHPGGIRLNYRLCR